jgi:hypothetical protein
MKIIGARQTGAHCELGTESNQAVWEILRAAGVVSIDYWVFLTTGDRQLFGGPLTPSGGRRVAGSSGKWHCWRMHDDQESERNHPLSEDVSPPVFAIVALVIVAIPLAVFALLGLFP